MVCFFQKKGNCQCFKMFLMFVIKMINHFRPWWWITWLSNSDVRWCQSATLQHNIGCTQDTCDEAPFLQAEAHGAGETWRWVKSGPSGGWTPKKHPWNEMYWSWIESQPSKRFLSFTFHVEVYSSRYAPEQKVVHSPSASEFQLKYLNHIETSYSQIPCFPNSQDGCLDGGRFGACWNCLATQVETRTQCWRGRSAPPGDSGSEGWGQYWR